MATYKFRILLDNENNEEIFRDIEINDDENFETFYKSILNSFSFKSDQMASFYLSNENWDKGHEISLMDINYGDEETDEISSMMSNSILNKKLVETKKLILVHDFMRMWIFLIELIEISNKKTSIPKIVLSVGVAPPEDSKSSDFVIDDNKNDFDDDFDDDFGSEFENGYDDEDFKQFEDEY